MQEIQELSALDLRFLVNEFNLLIDSRVENVYHKQDSFYIVLHKTGFAKKILKVIIPSFIYVTEIKEEMPEKPSSFCVVLRKYLKGARIVNIEQIGFERILRIILTSKSQELRLIIELVTPGNILLCNDKDKIIYPLYHQKWKDRIIKGGEIYQPIRKQINVLELSGDELNQLLRKTEAKSTVIFIARDLGFGGRYAEEICLKAGISKNAEKSSVDTNLLFKTIKDLLNEKRNINLILDQFLTDKTTKQVREEKQQIQSGKQQKLEKTIELQKSILKNLEDNVHANTTNGDLIYSNYNKVKEIIDTLSKAREKYSWKEIKEKLKDHKVITKIDEKTGKVTIELS